MASSLFLLLDDIATLLDDVATMTKVAAKKTAGVLGDDLALNAEQVSGVNAERELPVVWAVTKGSLVNKLILVPAALLVNYVAQQVITPLLMLGGAYLCFEGVEKIVHTLLQQDAEHEAHTSLIHAAAHDSHIDLLMVEKDKIKGAIRTDFVLSAEIIVIALGSVANSSFMQQAAVVAFIALIMTLGVYGLVAAIVKLDDVGFYCLRQPSPMLKNVGRALLWGAPKLMRLLSIVGTAAMFMVGGGILMHGFPWLSQLVLAVSPSLAWGQGLFETLANALLGIVVGGVLVAMLMIFSKLRGRMAKA